jgi:hypothetical protein
MGNNALELDLSGKYAGLPQFEAVAREHGMLDQYKDFQRAFFNDSDNTGAVLKNTIDEGTVFIPRKPNQVRSRFAAFDPLRRTEADLLASWLLPSGLMGTLGLEYFGYPDSGR